MSIAGTTKLNRVEENLGALDVTMTAEQLAALTDAAGRVQLAGERLPKPMLDMTGK